MVEQENDSQDGMQTIIQLWISTREEKVEANVAKSQSRAEKDNR